MALNITGLFQPIEQAGEIVLREQQLLLEAVRPRADASGGEVAVTIAQANTLTKTAERTGVP